MKQPKIIMREESDNAIETGASYRIEWPCGMRLWFDVWYDNGEITGDWNKYIFFTTDEQDMKEEAFQYANDDQTGAYNFMDALTLASDAYETLLKKQGVTINNI